jgi:hypothetical protein
MEKISSQLWVPPFGDYLASEKFARFRREHDLGDAWQEFLQLSRDRPDLYGSMVTKTAFSLFLAHIFHERPEEFLPLVAGIIAGGSGRHRGRLPVDEVSSSLLLLGYPRDTIDHALSITRGGQRTGPRQSGPAKKGTVNPGKRRSI